MNYKKYLTLSVMLFALLGFSLSSVIMMDSVLWQVCFVVISLIFFMAFIVCVCNFSEYKEKENIEQQIKRVEDMLNIATENDILEGCSFKGKLNIFSANLAHLKEDYLTKKISPLYITFGLNEIENELTYLVKIQEVALKIREYWNKIKTVSDADRNLANLNGKEKSHINIREQYTRVIETLSSPIFSNDDQKLNFYLTILRTVESNYRVALCGNNQPLTEV